jgi:hypothetical protein
VPVNDGLCFGALSATSVDSVVMDVLMVLNSPCRVVTPFRETLEAGGNVTTPLNVGSARGASPAVLPPPPPDVSIRSRRLCRDVPAKKTLVDAGKFTLPVNWGCDSGARRAMDVTAESMLLHKKSILLWSVSVNVVPFVRMTFAARGSVTEPVNVGESRLAFRARAVS